MSLDSFTLLTVSLAIGALLGLIWIGLSVGRHSLPGIRAWGLSLLGLSTASLLLALRGKVPPFLSIDLANLVVLLALAAAWHGARRFDGERPLLWPMLLPGAVWLGLRAVPELTAPVEMRVIILSLLSTPLILGTARQFAKGRAESPLLRGILAGVFVLQGVLMLLRIPAVMAAGNWQPGDGLPDNPWVQMVMLQAILQGVGVSFLLLALFRERGERRAIAAAAAAARSAEQASEAKSRFLARMSHELRTPLNGVLGLAQLVAARQDVPPAVRGQLAMIEGAGRHLLALVNDVLDLAQVEAGRLSLQRAPLALLPLLQEALALVRPEAERKRLALALLTAPGLPPAVCGDARRIRQILLNLLGNAVKFTPAGGRVTLSAAPLPGQGLRLEVLDSGPGIPPDQAARLFHDFQRLEDGMARAEGSGLGLAICAALALAMQGRIGVEAGPDGRGSRFWVELPLPPAALPQPAPPAAARPARPRRVLVVDDVAVNRVVAQALLQADGHSVLLASGGEEALALLEADAGIDLVLLDVQMPGIDGLETARRLRAWEAAMRPGAPRLPVLALTAEVGDAPRRACLEAGMDGHLSKPVERSALQAAIAAAPQPEAPLPAPGG
ncbi:ATP-binding protein [Pseudoroseomonas cervicalis]|uniref:ATP-binding protein n=1 Tax=Teichococcus cervicalis TaxID=204525 RepID=UPI0022F17DB3|nr:ATP-binding protein [Pseudoroseomonas cervicalis]WBV43894.1 response regulator [Pseudoroseomonas cervicalis]